MKKIFIVNPTSGDGKSIKIANEIKKILQENNENFEIYYTSAPREATDIAMSFNDDEPKIIYSVGGDGTLFEVVNGLAHSNNILGIIPAGTGNDFVKMIDNDDEITYVDLCRMNEHYFINIASVGIDAEIAKNKENMVRKYVPKSMRYVASIVDTFFKFDFPTFEGNINDKDFSQPITILAICNGKYYGGGFKIAPQAIFNDGMFDVYLVDKLSKVKIPGLIMKLIKGKHEDSKYVHKIQSDKVIIHSDTPINCNLDGEIFSLCDMEFEITNKKIPIYTANDKVKQFCKKKGLYK